VGWLGVALSLAVVAPGAQQPAAPAPAGTPSGPGFEELARQADAAREAGRLVEADRLYREALRLKPGWGQGWWLVGGLAYEQDRFAECRDAFRRVTELEPKSGAARAFLGLCQFGLGQRQAALRSLDAALQAGGLDDTVAGVALYHQAVLRIRASEFEAAIAPLTQLARARPETPELVSACGLLLLRRPLLPGDVPASDRALVDQSGRAYCAYLAGRADQARARFGELVAAHPRQEHVHYSYGLFLAQQAAPEAAEAFRKEIELHPGHVLANVELAFELLKRGQAADAVAPARAAVKLAPGLFATHLALGRALVESGSLAAGIRELEAAARIGPGVRETFWALANAYAQAGRKADAEAARATVRKLDALRRERGAAGQQPSGTSP
jgi:predicted Zn-dependent protease